MKQTQQRYLLPRPLWRNRRQCKWSTCCDSFSINDLFVPYMKTTLKKPILQMDKERRLGICNLKFFLRWLKNEEYFNGTFKRYCLPREQKKNRYQNTRALTNLTAKHQQILISVLPYYLAYWVCGHFGNICWTSCQGFHWKNKEVSGSTIHRTSQAHAIFCPALSIRTLECVH